MSHGEKPLFEAIEAIYSASTDATLWPAALRSMSSLFDACAITLLQNTTTGVGAVFASTGIGIEALGLYDEYYVATDPAVKAAVQLPVGAWASTDDLFSSSEYDRTEMVADLLLPNGLYRVAGSVLVRNTAEYASLGLHRPKNHPEFDHHDERVYMTVQPHLQRALAVTRQLGQAGIYRQALADSFDGLRTGVVVLDGGGRILVANRASREIAESRDGLSFDRDGPKGARSEDTSRLRKQIAEALGANGTKATRSVGSAIILGRPSGKRPLEVIVAPIGNGRSAPGGESGRVALYITDPESQVGAPAVWLQQLYRLTAAESAVTLHLANGSSLTETAEFLGVTRNTVRTHLQRILQKTDTRRQGELIKLVLGGPVGAVDPGTA